ncbi:hypothetical protein SLS62_007886 [Diatrype stigma]|uniref:Uncharacterized protein n=1 Tax=Diatrype stigma TaxID=117547 RepID=A0AAN9YPV6_9PEZI
MADKSIQEKQRRRQKAVKDPVCASRVIKNPLYGTGWSGKLSAEEKNMATGLLDDAAAMYALQINRNREVEPLSLHNAIFWEHRQLSDLTIVSTPALIWEQQQQLNELKITTGILHTVPFFALNKEAWKASLRQVLKQSSNASSDVEIHHLFANIRDREFTIWPVLVDGFWITIIMRVEVLDPPEFVRGPTSSFYFDRRVDKLAIIDPVYEKGEERRELVFKRLRNLLRQGCVLLPEESLINTFRGDQVESGWETGYISYAISREFLRRLKVLIYRRQHEASGEPDSEAERKLLWTAFEETPSINGYREALMSACSNYVIELSGYRIRSALEVPSAAAGHSAESLRPATAAGESSETVDEKINIGDQTHRFVLRMNLPEGYDEREPSIDSRPEVNLKEEEETDRDQKEEGKGEETDSPSSSDNEEERINIDKKAPVQEVQRARSSSLGVLPSFEGADDDKSSEVPENVLPQGQAPGSPEPQKELQTPPPTYISPRTPEPQTEAQQPYYQPSAFSTDPTAEFESRDEEDRLRAIAAAAQGLADAVEAPSQPLGEAITSEVVPVQRASTPPTQQEVDVQRSYSGPTIASMLIETEGPEGIANLPQAPAQAPGYDFPGESTTSELPVYPSTPEPGEDTETRAPEATMVDRAQGDEHTVPDAPETPEVQAQAETLPNDTDEIPAQIGEESSHTSMNNAPVPTAVDNLPTYSVTSSATAAAEPAAAQSEGEENKEDQEYDSIFGNGESPSAESDMFIPEEDGLETPAAEPTTTATEEALDNENNVDSNSEYVPVDAEHEALPPPPLAPAPASSPTPAQSGTGSGSSNNPIPIPGLSVSANTFSWSPLGKRDAEGQDGDDNGEETGQPSPKRQRLEEEHEEAPRSEPTADEKQEI